MQFTIAQLLNSWFPCLKKRKKENNKSNDRFYLILKYFFLTKLTRQQPETERLGQDMEETTKSNLEKYKVKTTSLPKKRSIGSLYGSKRKK